jgi:acetyl esterase/lipase
MSAIGVKCNVLLRALRNVGALLAASLLVSCSPLNVLNGLGPDNGYRHVTRVPYGNDARQQMDIYQPTVSRNGIVVVFFYGGGWRTGQGDEYRFVAQTLTRHGATVVIADYRLYPEVVFPVFMQDAAAAVAWTHRNIAQYGGDPKKIYLVGHSAGAHIVSLLALDARYLVAQGLDSHILAGVVGLATPTDFAATLDAKYRPVFVDQAQLERAQPVRYVRGDAPPMLLQHGADDTVVLPRNSLVLAERITGAGGQARAIVYPGKGHSGMLLIFSELYGRSPILHDTLDFLGLGVR